MRHCCSNASNSRTATGQLIPWIAEIALGPRPFESQSLAPFLVILTYVCAWQLALSSRLWTGNFNLSASAPPPPGLLDLIRIYEELCSVLTKLNFSMDPAFYSAEIGILLAAKRKI